MSTNQWIAAVINVMSRAIPPDTRLDENSAFHKLNDLAGIHVEKSVTLTGNGASVENLFKLTGTVQVLKIFGSCTEATDATTLSNFKFVLYDSTASVDMTGVVDASGALAGAAIYKEGLAAAAMIFCNPTVGNINEPAANKKTFEPIVCQQKSGADTFIRLAYTGDGSSDTDWTFECHYIQFQEGASLVAV